MHFECLGTGLAPRAKFKGRRCILLNIFATYLLPFYKEIQFAFDKRHASTEAIFSCGKKGEKKG
jgi:hypothetical protein